jgi:hypothetical protein
MSQTAIMFNMFNIFSILGGGGSTLHSTGPRVPFVHSTLSSLVNVTVYICLLIFVCKLFVYKITQ